MQMTISTNKTATEARQQIRSLLNNKTPLDEIVSRQFGLPHEQVQMLIIETINEIAKQKAPAVAPIKKKAKTSYRPEKTEQQKMNELCSKIPVEHNPEIDRCREIFNGLRLLKMAEEHQFSCEVAHDIVAKFNELRILPFEDCVIESIVALTGLDKQSAYQHVLALGAEVIRNQDGLV